MQDGLYQVNHAATLAFPILFDPKSFKGPNGKDKGDPKYSATFVLKNDHPDLQGLKAKVVEVAKAKWPGRDVIADMKAGAIKLPFSAGEKLIEKRVAKLKAAGKEDDGKGKFQEGSTVFKAKSDYPPGLGVVANGQIVEVTQDNKAVHRAAFYFGVQCLFRLNFSAYDGVDEGKPGVTAYLDMVLSLNKGDRLAGRQSAADIFKGVAGLISTEDPTAGEELADESVF